MIACGLIGMIICIHGSPWSGLSAQEIAEREEKHRPERSNTKRDTVENLAMKLLMQKKNFLAMTICVQKKLWIAHVPSLGWTTDIFCLLINMTVKHFIFIIIQTWFWKIFYQFNFRTTMFLENAIALWISVCKKYTTQWCQLEVSKYH